MDKYFSKTNEALGSKSRRLRHIINAKKNKRTLHVIKPRTRILDISDYSGHRCMSRAHMCDADTSSNHPNPSAKPRSVPMN
jgi:hypothetical protein